MYKIMRRSLTIFRSGSYMKSITNRSEISKISTNIQTFYKYLCTEVPMGTEGPNIEAIAKGDQDLEHKLKVLALEVEVMRQEGRTVPDDCYLKSHHWEELLKLPTISSRRRYLDYVFKVSKKKENRQMRREQKKAEAPPKPVINKEGESYEDFVQQYDLQHNNIFLRFYDTTINQMYNNRLIQAMRFGQKIVVDCGYDANMTSRENKNCAKQLMLLFAENRAHDDPYDLHLCNTNPNSELMLSLHRHIATLYDPSFPLNVHEVSYLDLFPREQLVYLTPHCREELTEYDHDAVYIIGGIVDKVNNDPLSLAKAKKEGLRMAKLPLDRYLQWGCGSGKSLTLNQVTSILLDVKHTNDWKFAMRHVPRRKVVDLDKFSAKIGGKKTWTPRSNQEFDKLGFKDTKRSNRVQIRSILYD